MLQSTAREGDATATAAAAAATPTARRTLCFKSSGKQHNQGRCGCTGCTKQTTYVCSTCMHDTDKTQKQFWFCNLTTTKGSQCFTEYVREKHGGGR
jgi:hypothetical protein